MYIYIWFVLRHSYLRRDVICTPIANARLFGGGNHVTHVLLACMVSFGDAVVLLVHRAAYFCDRSSISKQISTMERHGSARITLRAVLICVIAVVIAVNIAGYSIILALLLGVLLPLYLYWDA